MDRELRRALMLELDYLLSIPRAMVIQRVVGGSPLVSGSGYIEEVGLWVCRSCSATQSLSTNPCEYCGTCRTVGGGR